MSNMAIDWAWLCFQVALLLSVVFWELLKKRHRNLFAILIPITMLVLIQGQAIWLFAQFESSNQYIIAHLYNTISIDGARLANFYIGIGVVGYVVAYVLSTLLRVRTNNNIPSHLRPRLPTYLLVAVWVLIASIFLINQVGGIKALLEQPGRLVAGQTVFLLAIGLGKMPIMNKIAFHEKINIFDVIFGVFTFLIILFNSRFLAMFIVLQLFIVSNYCWAEVKRSTLLYVGIIAVAIFIFFGLYRDYAARYGTTGVQWLQIWLNNPQDINVFDWFYRANVEGFTGVAGVLSHEMWYGSLNNDFGFSELSVVLLYLPNAIRTDPNLPFAGLGQFLNGMYPYTASVVPSSVELAYGHFGLLGILGFCALLGFLTRYLHIWHS